MQHGVNFATLGARGEYDTGDELADGVDRLVAVLRVVESLGQPLDLAAIELGDVGVKIGDVERSFGEPLLEFELLCLQNRQPVQ